MTDVTARTEARNPATVSIDQVGTQRMLEMIYREDAAAVAAVSAVAADVAHAVDETYERIRRGGDVHYFGAGASGRLAVLDATETTPTFGVDPALFTPHFPGGTPAVTDSTIDLEDAADAGETDAGVLVPGSVAIGITASGSTSYVDGALRRASEIGAFRVLVTCNPEAPLAERADIVIAADTGPEALTGSTRLKAGTATKVILNSFSTAVMVRLGRTYSNLMTGLVATNDKLRERAVAILVEATSASGDDCRAALAAASGSIPVALTALLTGRSIEAARDAVEATGSTRAAVAALTT